MERKSDKQKWFGIRAPVLVLFFVVLLVGIPLGFLSQRMPHVNPRVVLTKTMLRGIRAEVAEFKKIMGRCPNSLSEIRRYAEQNPESRLSEAPYKEFLSDSENNQEEFNVLNGNGGWYYDKTTGEVKVNLTKPIKHHFKFYFGHSRNEIPSEW